ncbi:rIIB protector from prophage-induced early lysis protein [Rhizobium phage RHEph16]|uniref:RIIB protector from prophage-induced early lysis protein n=1 Tax=Rhizobium phage RHEph16 TaxID=2836132 RepID=A0AAE8AWK6_9CAUD|nr:RIIB lysis inhibitor [Rhizobium phage RHEph16]QXV74362.1 rIIB protector from prophage-induced early lysis protein [Rhizobium phage RHEph16]
MTQIRVKTIIVDDNTATFWLEDGSQYIVNQGEARLLRMIEKATPIIKAGQIAVIDTEEGVAEEEASSTIFSSFEQRSNGFMRFFRAAKDAVKNLFHTHEDDYSNKQVAPKVPVMAIMPTVFEESAKPQVQVDKGMYAPAKELAEGVPEPVKEIEEEIRLPDLAVKPLTSDVVTEKETVVAVLPNGRIIPGMENLKSHLDHAKDADQVEGIKKLVERMSVMLDKRAHSVDDLLRFMERGDMPVTINGDIIAYKVLNHANRGKPNGIYVDKHSGRVRQRVGSFVNVREDLVDKDRRNECSNGLHVARHGYLYAGSFSADKCFIILVAPEDVVTVPHNDPNKVRCMGYHVVAELPDEAYKLIKNRQPITQIPAMKALLAEIIKGNHVPRLESVQINGQYGADLKITPLGTREERIKWKFESTATEEEIQKAEAVKHIEEKAAKLKEQETAAKIDVKDLAKKVEDVKPESYVDRVQRALDEKDVPFIQELVNKKRKAKKAWITYDLSPLLGKKLIDFLAEQQIADKAPEVPEVKQDAAPEAPKTEPVKDTGAPKEPKEEGLFTKAYRAIDTKDSQLAMELVSKKRKAKKSWTAYGLSDEIGVALVELAGTATQVATTPALEPVEEAVLAVTSPDLSAPSKDWARYYYETKNWEALKKLKKAKKVNWVRLGFTPEEIEEITKH